MGASSVYSSELTLLYLSSSSDSIIDRKSTESSGTVVTTHGRIRATPLVALCWKHWSTNEIPSAERGAGATEKRSTTFSGPEPRLHNNKTPSWRLGEEQVSTDRGRQVRQAVFSL